MHQSCDFKIHGTTTVGSKGQIVIPKSVRSLLKINPGDDLILITKNDEAVVVMKSQDLEKFMSYLQSCIDETPKEQGNKDKGNK